MVVHNLYFGIIDYDVLGDCKFYLLFCCHSTSIDKFKQRVFRKTYVDVKYQGLLKVYKYEELNSSDIPDWFIGFNTYRYNGEGIYKEFFDYPVIDNQDALSIKPHMLDILTFCNVDYFATGEGRLTMYMATSEIDPAKIKKVFKDQLKVDDYFMICFEITDKDEVLDTYPEWFVALNYDRLYGTSCFQTYQNLS